MVQMIIDLTFKKTTKTEETRNILLLNQNYPTILKANHNKTLTCYRANPQ